MNYVNNLIIPEEAFYIKQAVHTSNYPKHSILYGETNIRIQCDEHSEKINPRWISKFDYKLTYILFNTEKNK